MGSVAHIARPGEAVRFVAFVLGLAGGELPVYLDGAASPDLWLACGPDRRGRPLGDRLAERVALWENARGAQVEVGAPRQKSEWRCSVLWVWADSPDALRRAAAFRPVPSMVVRMGASSSSRLCLWALEEPAPWNDVRVANERIAYNVHAPRTRAPVSELRVPMPGTFLRVGRSRPAPVMVTRMGLGSWGSWRDVAGGLKEPPPADAWRDRAD